MRGLYIAGVAALLGLSAEARADVVTQAHDIFTSSCSRCHSAERLRPKTSQHAEPALVTKKVYGKTVQTPGVDPLRQWLEESHENDPDTHCRANRLDPVQREIMIAYLRKKADPRARAWAPPRVAAAKNGGIAPPRPKRERKRDGQGDHR